MSVPTPTSHHPWAATVPRLPPSLAQDSQPIPWPALHLPGGEQVHLRATQPRDAQALLAFFSELSPEDRRLRFHCALRPGLGMVQQMCAALGQGQHAVLVCVGSGVQERIVAEARMVAPEDAPTAAERAEFSLVVAPHYRRMGIARWILACFEALAMAQGQRQLCGCIASENQPMRKLMQALSFELQPHGQDVGALQALLTLAAAPPCKQLIH